LLKGDEPPAADAGPDAPRAGDDLAPVARAAQRGAADAVRTLVSAVGPAVLKVVRRLMGAGHPEIEDASQEAVFAFVSALPGFRGECSTLHFACRIAVLTTLKRRRGRAEQDGARVSDMDMEDLPDGSERSPLTAAVAERRRIVLRELLGALPEPQAEALALHLMLGHSIEEVAAAAGVPGNTVRSRIRLGKEALRARIDADTRLAELLAVTERGR
jgi:RNA polymerase sigma-70 factor (ECF subfamily)